MQIDPMDMGHFSSAITASAMSVAFIQWLKNTKLVPFVDQHTTKLNMALGWCTAFVTAAGLHYKYDAVTGTLILTGITIAAIGHGIWDMLQQQALQWMIYKGIIGGGGQIPQPALPVKSSMPTTGAGEITVNAK